VTPSLLFVLMLASAPAQPPGLEQAARAAAEQRWDIAWDLADRRLKEGRAQSPTETAGVWAFLARASAALGDSAGAQRAFERTLELMPTYELTRFDSPRVAKPYDAARARLGGTHLLFSTRTSVHGSDAQTQFEIQGDVLGLAHTVRLVHVDEGGQEAERVVPRASGQVSWNCVKDPCRHRVVVQDAHGNALALAGSAEAPLMATRTQTRAWYRGPIPWLVGAGVSLGLAAYFGFAFGRDQRQLERWASPEERALHTRAEIAALDSQRKREHALMWLSFGTAAACGTVAGFRW
jgi:hypothetical protein